MSNIAPLQNGRDAIVMLRSTAEKWAEKAIPAATSAVERAGQSASKLALKSSKSLATTIKRRAPHSLNSGFLNSSFATTSLLRGTVRIARRNPALLAAAGVTMAAVGYLAWRHQSQVQALKEKQGEQPELLLTDAER